MCYKSTLHTKGVNLVVSLAARYSTIKQNCRNHVSNHKLAIITGDMVDPQRYDRID